MIIGLGCDIVNIKRIKQSEIFLQHFQRKILGAEEIKELEQKKIATERQRACILAKYYAGKEAFAKALGTGFINGIFFRDIQILHDQLGKPMLKISGAAKIYLQRLVPHTQLHISLSDDYPWAQAVVIIER